MSTCGLARDAEAAQAFEHDVEAAVVQLLAGADPAEAADLEQAGRLFSIPGLDHGDQPVAGERVADHRPIAGSKMCSGSWLRGKSRAPASGKIGTRRSALGHQPNRIAESRRRWAPAQGSSRPDRLEDLEQPLARRALVPFAVAGDAFEQLVGGAVAVALRHQRAGQVDPRLHGRPGRVRSAPRARPCRAAGRGLGQRQRGAGAGDRRVLRPSSPARSSSFARASSVRPAAISARARPEITSGCSGAMSTICSKMLAARSASPSPSTCSPIAISGSISASFCCASPCDRELGEELVERALELAFGARGGEVGDRLALEDRIDGRDRLDAELRRDQLLLVDVELDQLDALVGIIGGDLFEQRA